MVVFNGLLLSANGLFMLVAPAVWYEFVPGVTDTGFFNQHFIRDIGIIQLFLGVAFGVGMIRPELRVVLGRGNAVADRARGLPSVGSRGRHLLAVSHSARLSGRHPAGDLRGDSDSVGNT